jgi:hypothetical protein
MALLSLKVSLLFSLSLFPHVALLVHGIGLDTLWFTFRSSSEYELLISTIHLKFVVLINQWPIEQRQLEDIPVTFILVDAISAQWSQ